MTIRSNIEGMARQFFIGEKASEAIKGIKKLRKDGFAFVIDLLGEATMSEGRPKAYLQWFYMEVLRASQGRVRQVGRPGRKGDLDWGHAPRQRGGQPTAILPGQARGHQRFRGRHLRTREPIYRLVKEMGGFMCIDMERSSTRR
jgi:RHH-type proline utilization regulon transcriptional repressor/proline dehydrogenase/delta 1-pyrroline-5-carboxylate dehydrogenase